MKVEQLIQIKSEIKSEMKSENLIFKRLKVGEGEKLMTDQIF